MTRSDAQGTAANARGVAAGTNHAATGAAKSVKLPMVDANATRSANASGEAQGKQAESLETFGPAAAGPLLSLSMDSRLRGNDGFLAWWGKKALRPLY